MSYTRLEIHKNTGAKDTEIYILHAIIIHCLLSTYIEKFIFCVGIFVSGTSMEVMRYSIWCWKVSEDAKPRCQDHLYLGSFCDQSWKLRVTSHQVQEKLKCSCHFP